ncbi:MAG TPA: cupin domain-containing protein [Acidobacteriaceae bacterium]|jgi:oxalate decarboxylase|nr:cupin domain-containing protein [Acidobacteriaceae bacterium]
MAHGHSFSVSGGSLSFSSDLGEIAGVSKKEFPILKNLSIRRLTLAPGSIREPHWHPNAVELGYCVQGQGLIGVLGNADAFASFTITAGQMFYIPSGAIHHIENIGENNAIFIIAFRHEAPEDFGFSGSLGAMTDAVLGNTYDLSAGAFEPFKRSTISKQIVRREGAAVVPAIASFDNPLKFDIEAQHPLLSDAAGEVRFARDQFWPVLKNISMYSLRITNKGMREPHWHPETAEMGYVQSGKARMTVLNPEGSTETYLLNAGDAYFIPPAYPHHIEQMGDEAIRFLIFFDQPFPQDIGYRATGTAFSRPVLAATLGCDPEKLPQLPFTPTDPLIVNRINPRDL